MNSYTQVGYDLRSYERNLNNWKSQDFNGVWTRDLAIQVRRSNQLSYEATDVGSWSFVSSNKPVRNECEVIYETFHISLHIHFTECEVIYETWRWELVICEF